jgi:SAM-dependent methyltransferase
MCMTGTPLRVRSLTDTFLDMSDSPFNSSRDTPRWFTEKDEDHSAWYAEHFRDLASEGADLSGEARLVDAVVAPGSRILDAGCGQGRTAAALHHRGHRVTAVDIDPVLLAAARTDNPGPPYLEADLANLDLGAPLNAGYFDAAVSAGNVITFVAPGTEVQVLRSIRSHLRSDGLYLLGFHIDRYPLDEFDRDLAAAGFTLEHRFGTWDLRPFTNDSDFAVSILRND